MDNDVQGWVVVGTKLETKQLQKDLATAKKELTQFEKELDGLQKEKVKLEADLSEYENARQILELMRDEELELATTEEERKQILQNYVGPLEIINGAYDLTKEKLEDINQQIIENSQNQELVKEKIEEINGKLYQANVFRNINGSIEQIGKGLEKTIRKIGQWTLAIFGLRSAYMAVRNAINVISQDDAQLKADIDYMKNALAYTLEPVVRRIVELAKQLLFYIGYLIKSWFKYDIFGNANKSLKSANGQAKQLSKTLAGFDEMNVLSDTSGGGTSGGSIAPSFDLSNLDGEVPKWLQTIRDIGQWIIDNWQDVVFGLLLTKLFFDLITGNWLGVAIDFIGLLIIAFFKLKDAIKVIIESVKEIWGRFKEWFTEKWSALKQSIQDIWQSIVEWIKEKWSAFTEWIGNGIHSIGEFFKNLWQGIKDGFKSAIDWIRDRFSAMVDFFSNLISKIVGIFHTIGTKVGDAISGSFKAVINGVLGAIENILNFPIKQVNKLLDVINKVPGINITKLSTFSLPRMAKGAIINQPGRGVPVGYGGERGQEGVIPLTDSQQMALLGEAIGKYININATVPVYVGNRLLLREMKRIEAEDNFAYNR